MNFGQALELIKQGKKVKRAHWGGYWYIDKIRIKPHPEHAVFTNMILAFTKDYRYVPATAYQEDLLAEDWEIVE